jgi:AmmeMemoRadiSam system protein A
MNAGTLDDAALAATHGVALLTIAARAVRHGIDHGHAMALDAADCPEPLRVWRAAFVTLEHNGALQGCIGTIEPREALALSVARYAHGAAFQDPRFDPVRADHWPGLTAEISILTPRTLLPARSEDEALAALVPGVDGLVFSAGAHRSVFLPKVWDELPEPVQFLSFLKRKAGLDADYWSAEVKLERFGSVRVPPQPLRQLLPAS